MCVCIVKEGGNVCGTCTPAASDFGKRQKWAVIWQAGSAPAQNSTI